MHRWFFRRHRPSMKHCSGSEGCGARRPPPSRRMPSNGCQTTSDNAKSSVLLRSVRGLRRSAYRRGTEPPLTVLFGERLVRRWYATAVRTTPYLCVGTRSVGAGSLPWFATKVYGTTSVRTQVFLQPRGSPRSQHTLAFTYIVSVRGSLFVVRASLPTLWGNARASESPESPRLEKCARYLSSHKSTAHK